MRLTKLLAVAVLLGISNAAAAQTYSGLYTPYALWDTRIQHSGMVTLLDANGAVIGVLTLTSLFASPITAVFPPVGAATTGTKVRVVFNAVGTTNGIANLQSSCTTDYTLTTPSDVIPAGMSPKLVYTSRSLNPTLVITAEAPAIVDITPPTVSITAPGAGATFVGTNALTAIASDNVGVVGLQFLIDGANYAAEITVPPYTTVWNSTTVADGAHTVSARVRDAAGNTATSAPVSVKVSNAPPPPPPPDTTPPSVSITSPVAGATVSGTVSLTASATDNVGVVGVQFGLDGANLGAEDTTAPYSLSWVTSTVADGTHTLNAVARDAAGNRASSSLVTVTVANPPPPPLPTGESPDGSTIPPLAKIIQVNAAGTFTWTQVGTHPFINGSDSGGSGSDQLLYKAKVIYMHQSAGGGWWRWTGGSWAQIAGTP